MSREPTAGTRPRLLRPGPRNDREPPPPVEAAAPPWPGDLSGATATLGRLLGSTTIIGAILFYFGWSRAYYFYEYLGVDSSLLGLATGDYVQLSVDGVFVPVLLAGSGGLVAVWAGLRLREWAPVRAMTSTPGFGWFLDLAGLLLLANGLSRIYLVTPVNRPLAVAPASLAVGTWLIVTGLRRRGGGQRSPTAPGLVLVALVVGALCLFWAANDYSAAVGRSRARQYVAELPSQPDAVVLSAHRLRLSGVGVREEVCTDAEKVYSYRYSGLKLVLRSGDGLLFVPARWSRRRGVATFLPRDADVRLQFSPPGAGPPRTAC